MPLANLDPPEVSYADDRLALCRGRPPIFDPAGSQPSARERVGTFCQLKLVNQSEHLVRRDLLFAVRRSQIADRRSQTAVPWLR